MNILSIYLIIGMIAGIGDSIYWLIAYPEEYSHKWWMLIRHALILTITWPLSIIILIKWMSILIYKLLFIYLKEKKQFKKRDKELKMMIERNKRMVDEYWNLK